MAHVPRIFVNAGISAGTTVSLDGDQAHRLGAVMRVRPGDEVRVFRGDGREFAATVSTVAKGRVGLEVGVVTRVEPLPAVSLEVWWGLIRAQRMEWAVEKCTEAGVDVMRPIVSAHAARGDEVSPARLERWRRIAVEASEQCGRLHIPVVEQAGKWDELLGRLRTPIVLTAPGGRRIDELAPLLPQRGPVVVAVGPEGGFSEAEVAAAKAKGALMLGLGAHILRTETAAVVATAMVRSVVG